MWGMAPAAAYRFAHASELAAKLADQRTAVKEFIPPPRSGGGGPPQAVEGAAACTSVGVLPPQSASPTAPPQAGEHPIGSSTAQRGRGTAEGGGGGGRVHCQ